jgi:UDP-3-O-[3-hydroxymyristoyl] glucosamine N-acyltransferase
MPIVHHTRPGDPRFFAKAGPFSATAIAAAVGGEVVGADAMLTGLGPLQTAEADQLSFLDNRRYLDSLVDTKAGAVIIHPELASRVPQRCCAITTATPYRAWAMASALFHPAPVTKPGIDRSAVIDPTASCDPAAEIGPFVWIGAGAVVAAGCRIGSHASIGPGVVLGADCRIGSHVSLSHALLGQRVSILPGARIGQEGFGFDPTPTATGFTSVPQLGRVIIQDDVEIGANTTIDRGSAQDTVIGRGSRLDNLIQIGHNVRMGEYCIVVAQAGISGSTLLEDGVVVAAQAGLTGHLRIGRRSRVGAQAGVMADVADGASVIGSPAQPAKSFFREVAFVRKLCRDRRVERETTMAGDLT